MISAKQNRFVFLDGIRGIAAFAVFIGHSFPFWDFRVGHGYLAVDLFFVLSGFVIASAYEDKLASGMLSVGGFLAVRLIRIYPFFLISIPIAAVQFILDNPTVDTRRVIFSAFLTSVFIPSHIKTGDDDLLFPLNPVYWTLFYELVVNAMYVFVRPRLCDRALIALVLLLALGMTGVAWANGSLVIGPAWSVFQICGGFVRAAYGIFAGVLLFRKREVLKKKLHAIPPVLALLVVGSTLFFPFIETKLNVAVDVAVLTVVFPAGIVILSGAAQTKFEKPLIVLGAASYPLYVLHFTVSRLISDYYPGVSSYAPYSGICFGIILVSLCAFAEINFDIPLRKKLSRLALAPKA